MLEETNNLTEKAVTRPRLWHISLSGYQRVLTGPRLGHYSISIWREQTAAV